MQERRQNVRVRPVYDSAVEVFLKPSNSALDIVDVSIGGFGFLIREHALEVGQELTLEVRLPRQDSFEAKAAVRHVRSGSGKDMGGVQLLELTPDQATKLRRYVAELLERGQMR
ncbi:MAG: PilZ domain-containing protein [Myxococcota bacterium]